MFNEILEGVLNEFNRPNKFVSKNHINRQMNPETYKLRRAAIDYIYRAKNIFRQAGVEMPRIDIRITDLKDPKSDVLGTARLGAKVIWIPATTIGEMNILQQVVYHELLHAIYGIKHDENCPLMGSTVDDTLTPEQSDSLLLKYIEKFKGKSNV